MNITKILPSILNSISEMGIKRIFFDGSSTLSSYLIVETEDANTFVYDPRTKKFTKEESFVEAINKY